MTTLIMIDGDDGEPASDAINRRLREELAGRRLSETAAADLCGRKQQWLSRRLTGVTDWAVGELEQTCQALGLSFTYITTGIRQIPPMPPPNPPAPAVAWEPIQQTRRLRVAADSRAEVSDAVNDEALAYLRLVDETPILAERGPRRSARSRRSAGSASDQPDG